MAVSCRVPRSILGLAAVLVSGLLSGPAAAQTAGQIEVTMTDGQVRKGTLADWQGTELTLVENGTPERLTAAKVLFLHGAPTKLVRSGRMLLSLGEDELVCGEVIGGDPDGESLSVQAKSLGTLEVVLDSLRLLRVRQRDRFHSAARFAPGPGDADKEAVFRETELGLDPVNGILERFEPKGVWFVWRDEQKADLFPWDRIAGLRLPPEEPGEERPPLELVIATTDGCRIRGVPRGITNGRLALASRWLGDVTVAMDMVLAGHVEHPESRLFLSRLEPAALSERTFWEPKPDLPWRRDVNVMGDSLQVRRRFWTVGLGCHSLSRLDFEVPDGVEVFRCWIGADDSAVGTDVFGDMDFTVYVGGKAVATKKGVKGGQRAVAFDPVPVRPGDVVRLEVDFGSLVDILDRGNWLAPVFLK